MKSAKVSVIAILIGAVGIICYVQSIGFAAHSTDNAHNQLVELRFANDAIDREVLAIASGHKPNFDALTEFTNQLVAAPILGVDADAVSRSIQHKSMAIEDFKSDIAVYRNSANASRRLIELLATENQGNDPALDRIVAPLLIALAFQDAPSANSLGYALEQIQPFRNELATDVQALITHAQIVAAIGERKQESQRALGNHELGNRLRILTSRSQIEVRAVQQSLKNRQHALVATVIALLCIVLWTRRRARGTPLPTHTP